MDPSPAIKVPGRASLQGTMRGRQLAVRTAALSSPLLSTPLRSAASIKLTAQLENQGPGIGLFSKQPSKARGYRFST